MNIFIHSYRYSLGSFSYLLFLLLWANPADAQIIKGWIGVQDNQWHNSANWSPAGVPNANQIVRIPPSFRPPVISGGVTAEARQVSVESGGVLTIGYGSSHGTLNLSPVAGDALINSGTVTNNGVINISRKNQESNKHGIWNIGTFDNQADGNFPNTGVINIDGTDLFAIANRSGANFTNYVNSSINIGTANAIEYVGLDNRGSFINEGTLSIKETTIYGIQLASGGTFTNNSTGTINIGQQDGQITTYGIAVYHTGTVFTNDGGIVNIDNIVPGEPNAVDAISVQLGAQFINKNQGEIRIGQGEGNIGRRGFHVSGTASSLINDDGFIKINNTRGDGIHLVNEAGVINKNGGEIWLGQSTGLIEGAGIGNNASCSFDNESKAKIYVGQQAVINGNAINNFGTFNNKDCGTAIHIFSDNPLVNTGTFNNSGTIIENSSANSSITTNNGLIVNMNGGAFTCSGNTPLAMTNVGDRLWTGCQSNDWSNADNWFPSSLPSASASTVIAPVANQPVVSSNTAVSIADLRIPKGATLDIAVNAALTIANSSAAGIINEGTISNRGSLKIDDTAQEAILNEATGVFNNTSAGVIQIGRNGGNIGGPGISNIGGTFTNADATILIDHAFRGVENIDGATFHNYANGNIILGEAGPLPGSSINGGIGAPSTFFNHGCGSILNYSGSLDNDELVNDGVLIHHSQELSRIGQNNGIVHNLGGASFIVLSGHAAISDPNVSIWTGCANGNFEIPGNWHNRKFPGDGNEVIIAGSEQSPTLSGHGNHTFKSIHIKSGAELTLTDSPWLFIAEDWINNGSFTAGTSNVTMTGSAPAQIGGSHSNSFFNLIVNKTAKVVVANDLSASNAMNLDSGELEIPNGVLVSTGPVIVANGTTLTNNGTLASTNILRIKDHGTLQGDGVYELELAFVAEPNAVFQPGTSKVIMNGSNDISEIYMKHNNDIDFYDLEISKSAGFSQISGFLDVINTVTITQGTLSVTSGNGVNPRDLVIESNGVLDLAGNSLIRGNLTNSGTFQAGNNSLVRFWGDTPSQINGNSFITFNRLRMDKADQNLQLNTNCTVSDELEMLAGNLDLNGNVLTMDGVIKNESASSYIYGDGHIVKTAELDAPNGINPGNVGVAITSTANLGTTTIRRFHNAQDVNGEMSIGRFYDIAPANNLGLDATVRFHYMDHELNGLAENDLLPFRYENPDWADYQTSDNDDTGNWVETMNVNAFSQWTLAGSASAMTTDLQTIRDDEPVQLFPNPFSGEIHVVNGIGSAIIFNSWGQALKRFTITDKTWQVKTDDLPNGIYTLFIQKRDGEKLTVKMVK